MRVGVLCYDWQPMLCKSFPNYFLCESCCFLINASSGIVDLILPITDLFILLAVHGCTSMHVNSSSLPVLLSSTTGKTIAFTIRNFVSDCYFFVFQFLV